MVACRTASHALALSVVVYDMVVLLFEHSIEMMMNCVLFEFSIARACRYCISNEAVFVTTNQYKPCIGISCALLSVDESSY